ncbi:MAG TPA: ribonuclease Z [Thermomicrobiales bacterium]
MIDLLLLGTGGMMPLPDRWLSALLVRSGGDLVLFDCGEGTQIPWRRFSWGFRRLGAICLSHWHADHVAGLPGLLHTVANAGKVEPLQIFGPPGTARVVAGLREIAPVLPYPVEVQELEGGESFPLPGGLIGHALRVEHSVPCLAYRVERPRAPRFDAERAVAMGIPVQLWRRLQNGESVQWDGGSAEPEQVLGPPRPGVSFGYVTDTRPVLVLTSFLAGVELLVCEGTYGSSDDLPKAIERQHMTFAEAATIARDAGAGELWLTHFSPALENPEAFLAEAASIFPRVTIGYSGLATTLAFARDDAPSVREG